MANNTNTLYVLSYSYRLLRGGAVPGRAPPTPAPAASTTFAAAASILVVVVVAAPAITPSRRRPTESESPSPVVVAAAVVASTANPIPILPVTILTAIMDVSSCARMTSAPRGPVSSPLFTTSRRRMNVGNPHDTFT